MNKDEDFPEDDPLGEAVSPTPAGPEPPFGALAEDQVIEPTNALPEITLEDLSEPLRQAAARAGWNRLMPVQAKAIPYFLARRDLMIQSQTGSGKTGAYLLPILERIDPEKAVCQALVLVPTRELAQQVGKEADLLGEARGVRSIAVYGGVGYGPQLDAFKNGAHLVIGTPGRILDHLLKRSLTLQQLQILIFDEADRMLSMGFYPDMKQVQEYLPDRRINGYMLSATFPEFVLRLARQFLHEPEFLSLSRDQVHVASTEHAYYIASGMDKDRALIRIIEIENPVSVLIFGNTKSTVHYLTVVLQRFGYDADELSSDLSQAAREKVMERIKKRELRFLVATDVAARGIDIHDLSHVIQYEPPEDPELYIHRVGRTGRAGAAGVAFSLVTPLEEIKLKQIAKRFGIELQERPVPENADVETLVAQRITALLESELRTRDSLQVERMKRFLPLVRDLGQGEEESSLVAMLLDDYYQKTLHARPPQPPLEEKFKDRPGGKKSQPRKRGRKDRPRRR